MNKYNQLETHSSIKKPITSSQKIHQFETHEKKSLTLPLLSTSHLVTASFNTQSINFLNINGSQILKFHRHFLLCYTETQNTNHKII